MRIYRLATLSACLLTLTIPSFASRHTRRGPTAARVSHHHAVKAHPVGQRAIDDERAAQLQAALIKAGYLTGEPSGHWDSATEAAMTKLQADNGWQTKLVPDSRAIIKLGLGPGSDQGSTPALPPSNLTGSIAASQSGIASLQ